MTIVSHSRGKDDCQSSHLGRLGCPFCQLVHSEARFSFGTKLAGLLAFNMDIGKVSLASARAEVKEPIREQSEGQLLGVVAGRVLYMEARNRIQQDSGYWERVLEAIPAGLSIHSTDSIILNVNKKLGEIHDKPPEEFLGRTCAELFHQGASPCPHEFVVQSMTQAEVKTAIGAQTYDVILSPVLDSEGVALGFTRMMIETIHRPKTLARLEGTGTIEQMISGIAHDVGTPLGIISGYSEYLLMRSKAGEAGHKELSTILQQTRRIADSIKQMLDLVRPSSGRADAIGLKGFLAELVELMGHHLRKANVNAHVSCTTSPPLIYGDAPKLRRAFFNLVINVLEQIGPGGEIELILSNVPGRSDLVNIVLAAAPDSGPAPDFAEAFSGILNDREENAPVAQGLSFTRDILEGFKAQIETIALDEPRAGLSISIPVRPNVR